MTVQRHAFSIQLTERCNLACRYCYVQRRSHPDLEDCTPDFCERFVDFARRYAQGPVKITFFGGEPMLRSDLIRHTVAYAKRTADEVGAWPTRYHIVTNGTLLDEAMGDFIAAEKIGLEVSLDGPEAVHDVNRIGPDGATSFRRVYGNLLRFVERHPGHPVDIFAVLTDPGALPWLQALCRALEVRGLTINPVRLAPDDPHRNGCRRIAKQAWDQRIDRHREAFLGGDAAAGDDEIRAAMAALVGSMPATPCGAGIDATIVTRSGEIYPCPFFVGHPDQNIGHIDHGFDPERVSSFEARHRAVLKSCRSCGARRVCVSGCAFNAYETSGRVDVTAPQACHDTRRHVRRLEEALVGLAARTPERLFEAIVGPLPGAAPAGAPMPAAPAPRSFVIRLTGRCNLSCDYCYEQGGAAGRDDLDRDAAKRIVRHILSGSEAEPLVCLFGGEPLLNWNIAEYLINELVRGGRRVGKRPAFHLTTNATRVTPAVARMVARHDITVQVSVDGPTEIHDRHRKHADGHGTWAEMVRGVERLKAVHPRAKIDAQAVVTPGPVDLVGTARYLKSMGFRRISFLTAGWEIHTGLIWSDEAIVALMRAREDFFPFFIQSALDGNADVDMGFASLVAAESDGPPGICECGSGEVFIDTDGGIHRCPQLYAAGQPAIGRCGHPDGNGGMSHDPGQRIADDDCRACWAWARCRGGCMVSNQRCAWMSSQTPNGRQKLWCDLMRAEFARAMLAWRILAHRRPRTVERLKALFGA